MLAALGRLTFSQTFSHVNTPEDMEAYLSSSFSPEIQAAELAVPGATVFIVEEDGEPLGTARLQPSEAPTCITGQKPIELVRIYILAESKGQHLGSRLMQACLEAARGGGYDTIWLGVWEKNPNAIAFYQHWGFTRVGSHIFQLGSDAQTDLLMQRPVTE